MLDKPDSDSYPSVGKGPGQMGYEGIFQYAMACFAIGREDKAKELFSMIKDIPTKCFPIRLEDIRVDSLKFLRDEFGMPLDEEMEAARIHQY